ncbi:hypothetical protein B0F90DRAFT_1750686, partial [Multifurca ochricompacta]
MSIWTPIFRMGGDSYYDSENGGDLVTRDTGRMDEERDHRQIHHQRVTIHVLPDDVLVEIFYFYRLRTYNHPHLWHKLVHICRRWRYVVFSSSRRLDLQLLCRPEKPVRRSLDCWPELPLVISRPLSRQKYRLADDEEDNIVAALERPSRIFEISLYLTDSLLGKVGTLIQQPFPELKKIDLSSNWRALPVPDNFLGGFAPRLCELTLNSIPFPGLPKFLLSANGLVRLELRGILTGGCISSEAMANCLSGMSKLDHLWIEFQSKTSHPRSKNQRSPSLTRAILPALTYFKFEGTSEYLEDLVARIHAPLLKGLRIIFFDKLVFDILQLSQFICLMEKVKIRDYLSFDIHIPNTGHDMDMGSTDKNLILWFSLSIPFLPRDRHLSCTIRICDQLSPLRSHLQELGLYGDKRLSLQDVPEWLDLLRLFPTVYSLTVCDYIWPHVTAVQDELNEDSAMGILPSLTELRIDSPGTLTTYPVERFITAGRNL